MADLSQHFSRKEFACPCCGAAEMNPELIDALEALRAQIGAPIRILSGFRCGPHNKEVGGAERSTHLTGSAADIRVPGLTPWAIYGYARSIGAFRGIGVDSQRNMIHLDIGPRRAKWCYLNGRQVAWQEPQTA